MTNPTQITSLRIPTETLTAARTLTEADSGKTFLLDLAGGFTVTMPPVAKAGNGFHVNFIIKTASAGYVITEDATVDANVMTGGNTSAAVSGAANASAAFTQINFTAGQAIAGDSASITSNGVRYYTRCHSNVVAGCTLT